MKWPSWLTPKSRRQPSPPLPPPEPSLTACPDCGREMDRIDKSTMSGYDMRTYRCEPCGKEHVVNFGPALWKILSDAREAEEKGEKGNG
jgi:DNA-directed RNA polymerase subunit RPC12/RpoP